jgi:anti-sigma regulatory factor (Ser/Thr protein kinase)
MAGTVLGVHDMVAHGRAVRTARRWLYGVLAADHAGISDGIALLTSELVTNSIRHSRSGEPGADGMPGRITIVVMEVDDLLRVEVVDAGSAARIPRIVDHGPDATSGRGLRIVDELTGGRWGAYAEGAGRVVWFAVPSPRG